MDTVDTVRKQARQARHSILTALALAFGLVYKFRVDRTDSSGVTISFGGSFPAVTAPTAPAAVRGLSIRLGLRVAGLTWTQWEERLMV